MCGKPSCDGTVNPNKLHLQHSPTHVQLIIVSMPANILIMMPTGSKLIFRFEPFILAAECRDMDSAQKLVAVARQAGFRESGVTATKARTIAGIRCSLRLEVLHLPPTPLTSLLWPLIAVLSPRHATSVSALMPSCWYNSFAMTADIGYWPTAGWSA